MLDAPQAQVTTSSGEQDVILAFQVTKLIVFISKLEVPLQTKQALGKTIASLLGEDGKPLVLPSKMDELEAKLKQTIKGKYPKEPLHTFLQAIKGKMGDSYPLGNFADPVDNIYIALLNAKIIAENKENPLDPDLHQPLIPYNQVLTKEQRAAYHAQVLSEWGSKINDMEKSPSESEGRDAAISSLLGKKHTVTQKTELQELAEIIRSELVRKSIAIPKNVCEEVLKYISQEYQKSVITAKHPDEEAESRREAKEKAAEYFDTLVKNSGLTSTAIAALLKKEGINLSDAAIRDWRKGTAIRPDCVNPLSEIFKLDENEKSTFKGLVEACHPPEMGERWDNIGYALRTLRTRLGLNPKDVAGGIGVTRSAYQNYESGTSNAVRKKIIDYFKEVAAKKGITITEEEEKKFMAAPEGGYRYKDKSSRGRG